MVRVLIVDDSVTIRQTLRAIIEATEDMQVVGEACDGHQAVQMAHDLRPDVIAMDIVMPGMDGLAATREIMRTTPTPIVLITASFGGEETDVAFQALRSGALTILPKPVLSRDPQYAAHADKLVKSVRSMATVRVIHHRQNGDLFAAKNGHCSLRLHVSHSNPELVAIVASTGGPAALATVLKGLPADFRLPIVIVQHLTSDFLPSLVRWLDKLTWRQVTIARLGEQPRPEYVYLAPCSAHLCLTQDRRFVLNTAQVSSYVPSGDILLESVANSFGPNAAGVILTGMGDDGARGLHLLRDVGGFTIAQDEDSSVVFGMPGAAIAKGAAQHVLPLSDIPDMLARLVRHEETMQ